MIQAVYSPVNCNGALHTAQDVLRMKEQTGCDGFMIARGAQGNPWIFSQILYTLQTGKEAPAPTAREVADMVLRHARMQLEWKGNYTGIREMRKHAAWYTSGYRHASKFRSGLNAVETYEQLKELMERFAESTPANDHDDIQQACGGHVWG